MQGLRGWWGSVEQSRESEAGSLEPLVNLGRECIRPNSSKSVQFKLQIDPIANGVRISNSKIPMEVSTEQMRLDAEAVSFLET